MAHLTLPHGTLVCCGTVVKNTDLVSLFHSLQYGSLFSHKSFGPSVVTSVIGSHDANISLTIDFPV